MRSLYRAAVWTENDNVEVEEREVPVPGQGEVLLKIMAAGICGTDLHILSGAHPLARSPLVPGHEFAGEIVEAGKGVDRGLLGARVGSDSYFGCGKCLFCLSGRAQLCSKGTCEFGIDRDGGWAEYIVVPEKNIYILPDGVEYFEAGAGCILNCPMAAVEMVGIEPGDTVLIIGDGPSSLVMVQLARLKGASSVILAGHRERRLNLALTLGADRVFNTHNTDLIEALESLAIEPNVVIDAVGRSETFREAVLLASKEGRIHLFGLPGGTMNNIPMDTFLFKELTVTGSTGRPSLWPTAMEYLSRGFLNVKPIISHRFTIDKAGEAIDFIRANPSEIVKAIFEMGS